MYDDHQEVDVEVQAKRWNHWLLQAVIITTVVCAAYLSGVNSTRTHSALRVEKAYKAGIAKGEDRIIEMLKTRQKAKEIIERFGKGG